MNKPSVNTLFYGCPAGLGNRYEELVKLSNFAVKNDIVIRYYWNNAGKSKYKNLFKAKNITIETIDQLNSWPTNNFESSRYWREYISSRSIGYSNQVKLDFSLIETRGKYIGIHIRGTDRIVDSNTGHPGFQTVKDLDESILNTKNYLLENNCNLPLVIFSEDLSLKKRLINELHMFEIINLPIVENIDFEYQDLYNLSKSERIIMCSKFSTFALTAAALGNTKIVNFFSDNRQLLRTWDLEYLDFPKKSINQEASLNFLDKSSNDSERIEIGNSNISSYEVSEVSLNNSEILISFNTSQYIGVEENIKLHNKNLKVQMYNMSLLLNMFKEVIRVLKSEKNRKNKITILLKENLKTFKIFKTKTFLFKSTASYLKTAHFIYINTEFLPKRLNLIFNPSTTKGAIITFNNMDEEKETLDEVIQLLTPKEFRYYINNKNSGYLSISG